MQCFFFVCLFFVFVFLVFKIQSLQINIETFICQILDVSVWYWSSMMRLLVKALVSARQKYYKLYVLSPHCFLNYQYIICMVCLVCFDYITLNMLKYNHVVMVVAVWHLLIWIICNTHDTDIRISCILYYVSPGWGWVHRFVSVLCSRLETSIDSLSMSLLKNIVMQSIAFVFLQEDMSQKGWICVLCVQRWYMYHTGNSPVYTISMLLNIWLHVYNMKFRYRRGTGVPNCINEEQDGTSYTMHCCVYTHVQM